MLFRSNSLELKCSGLSPCTCGCLSRAGAWGTGSVSSREGARCRPAFHVFIAHKREPSVFLSRVQGVSFQHPGSGVQTEEGSDGELNDESIPLPPFLA